MTEEMRMQEPAAVNPFSLEFMRASLRSEQARRIFDELLSGSSILAPSVLAGNSSILKIIDLAIKANHTIAVSKNNFWHNKGIMLADYINNPSNREIESIGMVPDMLIVDCDSMKMAQIAAKWTLIGTSVICLAESIRIKGRPLSHKELSELERDFNFIISYDANGEILIKTGKIKLTCDQ